MIFINNTTVRHVWQQVVGIIVDGIMLDVAGGYIYDMVGEMSERRNVVLMSQ